MRLPLARDPDAASPSTRPSVGCSSALGTTTRFCGPPRRRRRYTEWLGRYANDPAADDVLYALGVLRLTQGRDPAAAGTIFDMLLARYPASNWRNEAIYLDGLSHELAVTAGPRSDGMVRSSLDSPTASRMRAFGSGASSALWPDLLIRHPFAEREPTRSGPGAPREPRADSPRLSHASPVAARYLGPGQEADGVTGSASRSVKVAPVRLVWRDVVLVGLIWLTGQTILYHWVGPREGGDTIRYVEAAAAWGQGQWPLGRDAFFPIYNLFLAALFGLGLGLQASCWFSVC